MGTMEGLCVWVFRHSVLSVSAWNLLKDDGDPWAYSRTGGVGGEARPSGWRGESFLEGCRVGTGRCAAWGSGTSDLSLFCSWLVLLSPVALFSGGHW